MMVRLTECSACQIGDHRRHQEVVQAVPEGVMGGSRCPCKGECRKDKDARVRRFLERNLPWTFGGALLIWAIWCFV